MEKKSRTLEDYLFLTGIIVLVIGLPLAIVYVSKIDEGIYPPCMLNAVFGLYCPGCGGSRAVKSLFQGKILTSLYYHPVVLYTVVIYAVFMISHILRYITKGRIKGIRFHSWFLYVALIIIAVNCILKNVLKLVWNISM